MVNPLACLRPRSQSPVLPKVVDAGVEEREAFQIVTPPCSAGHLQGGIWAGRAVPRAAAGAFQGPNKAGLGFPCS